MKRFYFVILIVATSFFAKAQSFKLIAEAGLSESTFRSGGSINAGSFTTTNSFSSIAGFHAGVVADLKVKKLSIQPGIFYSQKGNTDHYSLNGVFPSSGNSASTTMTVENGKTMLNYLEIPVDVLYNFGAANKVSFFAGGGPYAGLGLSGKTTYTSTSTVTNGSYTTTSSSGSTNNVTFGTSEGTYKTINAGINFKAGINVMKKYRLSVSYNVDVTGVTNNGIIIIDSQTTYIYPKFYNNTLKVSLGYEFL